MLDQVRDAIKGLVADNTIFTAYDVTVTLRNDGEFAKHGDVRNHVHSLFEDEEDIFGFGYEKTMSDIDGGARAFVFHPVGEDPEDHAPVAKTYDGGSNPNPKVQTAPTPAARVPGSRNKQPVNGEMIGARPASSGRLNVPSVLLKKIGQGPWSAVFDASKVYILHTSDTNGMTNADGSSPINFKSSGIHDIRVSPKILRHLNASLYDIKLGTNCVTIEAN